MFTHASHGVSGGALLVADELDGALGGPGGLVQRRRHARRILDQLAEHGAVLPHPVGVVVPTGQSSRGPWL